MIKEGQKKRAEYWGNFSVKKVVQLDRPVICHSDEKGKALHEPTLVKIEWEKIPSSDKHEFWFPYWITWVDMDGKQRYGQGAPMIGEGSFFELLRKAINNDFFTKSFLKKLNNIIVEKISYN